MKKRIITAKDGRKNQNSAENVLSVAGPGFQAPSAKSGVAGALLANARQQNVSFSSLDPIVAAEQAQRSGRLKEAEVAYKDILKRQPDHVRALTLYGILLNQREKFPEAVRILKKSIKLNPLQEEAFNGLGMAYKSLDRSADAIKAFEKALEINPAFAGVLNNMGVAYRELGNFDAAAGCFERALKIDPNTAEAWNGLARTRKFTTAPDNLDQLSELTQSPGMTRLARKHAWFALGKIYDDLGRFDDAFACYQKGNELRLVPADARYPCEFMRDMADVFTADRVRQMPRVTVKRDDPMPVFIIGMPRSGTTLVEQIIASHPKAIGGGELNFFTIEARKRGLDLTDGHSSSFFQSIEGITERELRKIRHDFFSNFRAQKKTRVLIDKTPFNFLYVGMIAMALPDAKFIHCRRDPLDTGLSIFFTDFAKNQPFSTDLSAIGHYTSCYNSLMGHWHKVKVAPVFDVEYEMLIDGQETLTRDILEFCDLPWDDRCLSFHETQRYVSTPSDWQVRQPIYKGSIGRWQHYDRYLKPLRDALS